MSKTSSKRFTRIRVSRIVTTVLLPLGVILGLLASPGLANGQGDEDKKKAKKFYKQGTTQFKLGNFDKAIELFQKAFELSEHPSLLFNLGQAYRQKGDCKRAIFAYKGYLSESGSKARNRKLVESHIEELTKICKAQDNSRDKPPHGVSSTEGNSASGSEGTDSGTSSNSGKTTGDTGDGTTDENTGSGVDVAAVDKNGAVSGGMQSAVVGGGRLEDSMEPWKPSVLSASVKAGPSLLGFGGGLQVDGARPTISVSAGYPLQFGKFGVNIGGMFTYTPIQWELDGMSGTSTLMSALFHIGVRYWVIDKLSLGADLAGGGQFLSGLDDGNLFLDPDTEATGALSMPHVRVGVAVEYLLTNNLMITASPFVYSMSPPKDGLRDEVETMTRMEFMLGMGFRM